MRRFRRLEPEDRPGTYGGEHGLDELLHSPEQAEVARLVGSLRDEAPSLAWRGALGERLAAERMRVERNARWAFVMRPAAGLALAGALAVVIMIRPSEPARQNTSTSRVEARLLGAHRDVVFSRMIAGRGLMAEEARPTSMASEQGPRWQETDLGVL
jgi:hypothetical protein